MNTPNRLTMSRILFAGGVFMILELIRQATNNNNILKKNLPTLNYTKLLLFIVTTITNAMDISLPNNFPRVLELGERHGLPLAQLLSSLALDDEATRQAIVAVDAELVKLEQEFEQNIRDDVREVRVPTEALAKLPTNYLN